MRPGLSSLYPSLIDLLKRTGNGSLALEYVNEYKNARILTLRESRTKAGVLAGEGEYRSALEELESLTTKSGENLDLLSLADFQAKRELYDEALMTFDQISKVTGSPVEMLLEENPFKSSSRLVTNYCVQ